MQFTPQPPEPDHNEQGQPEPPQSFRPVQMSQSQDEPQEFQPPKMDRNTKLILAVAGVGVLLAGVGLIWNMTRAPQRAAAAAAAPAAPNFFTEQQRMMREAIQMARDAQQMQRERMDLMRQELEGNYYESVSVPTDNPLSDPELGLGGKP